MTENGIPNYCGLAVQIESEIFEKMVKEAHDSKAVKVVEVRIVIDDEKKEGVFDDQAETRREIHGRGGPGAFASCLSEVGVGDEWGLGCDCVCGCWVGGIWVVVGKVPDCRVCALLFVRVAVRCLLFFDEPGLGKDALVWKGNQVNDKVCIGCRRGALAAKRKVALRIEISRWALGVAIHANNLSRSNPIAPTLVA